MKAALFGHRSAHRDAVREEIESSDAELVYERDDADLLFFVGPVGESPFSGCDNDVRILSVRQSMQSVRLKARVALRTFGNDGTTSVYSRERASGDGRGGRGETYAAFAREREAEDGE